MGGIINWAIENKEWLFSGVGLALLAGLGSIIFNKRHTTHTQTIKSGNNSTNMQSGRDINIVNTKMRSDAEDE